MKNLIQANCELLMQGAELLSRHDDSSYQATDLATFGSGIGPHFRHVLDHYRSFLPGVETSLIDYDDRKRGTEVEKSPARAVEEIASILDALRKLDIDVNARVNICVSASTEGADLCSKSSFGRELQFLVSHTVHHYALIAIASRMQGIFPKQSFGVAPSTLKFLKASGA